MSADSLTALAEKVLALAKQVDSYESTGKEPSAGRYAIPNLPSEAIKHRADFLDVLNELHRTALGPTQWLFEHAIQFNVLLGLQALYRYSIPLHVPTEGTISFTDLAKATGRDERTIRRFVRYVMLYGLFSEPEEGFVKHTPYSLYLKEDLDVLGLLGHFAEDHASASIRTLDALEKWPGSDEPIHSGFNLANDTTDPCFIHIAKFPERLKRASGTFRASQRLQGPDFVTETSLWRDIDVPGSLLVDVGGNKGHISQSLAAVTTNLKFVVQDLPETVKDAELTIAEKFRDRISFASHNFFEPQPVKDADVYFFRVVLHDWPDKSCVKILQNLIPALKEGAKVVLIEQLLPEVGSASVRQKIPRNADLVMLSNFNSQERTRKEWQALFAEADPRFADFKTESWPGTVFSLIQTTWKP